MALTPKDKKDLVDVLTTVLDQRRSVNEEQHNIDHMWVQEQISYHQQKRHRREEFHAALKRNVITWAIISAFAGLSVLVYGWFEYAVRRISG